MKKRIISALLIATITITCFAGCGKKEEEAPADVVTDTTVEEASDVEDTDAQETTAPIQEEEVIEANSVATKLQVQFREEIRNNTNIEMVADELKKNDCFGEVSVMTMVLEEGYLTGFDEEIMGFDRCVMIAPEIGTIPMVAYIFETGSPEALKETLESHAMLNWNLCTEADEMVVDIFDGYVFFAMAPTSFEQ